MSRLNGLQNKLRREAVSFNRILDTLPKYSEIITDLFNDFTAIAQKGEKPSLNKVSKTTTTQQTSDIHIQL